MNQKRRDRRLEMVIPFLQGKKLVHEVALENKMSKSGVEYWIKQARKDLETTGQDVKSTFVPADFVELSLKDKDNKEPEKNAANLQIEITLPNGVHIKIYK